MHACGHDCARRHPDGRGRGAGRAARRSCAARVKFIFQPAEETAARGRGGRREADDRARARWRIRVPQAIFGLHVTSRLPRRHDRLPPGPDDGQRRHASASPCTAGRRTARRRGSASTRSSPRRRSCWACRPSSAARSTSRREPAVVTVGMIKGGVRENIIPDKVEMRGTIRTFDEAMRDDIHERVTTLAEAIARGARAGCTRLHQQELPGHRQRPGADRGDAADAASASPAPARCSWCPRSTGAEDFSFFQRVVPGPVLLRRRRRPRAGSASRRRRTTRRASSSTSARCWSACARWRTWPATSSRRSARRAERRAAGSRAARSGRAGAARTRCPGASGRARRRGRRARCAARRQDLAAAVGAQLATRGQHRFAQDHELAAACCSARAEPELLGGEQRLVEPADRFERGAACRTGSSRR